MNQNILLIISVVIFIGAILTSGAMTNWWQKESKNIKPMSKPTPKPMSKPMSKMTFQNLSDLKSAISAYFNIPSEKKSAIGNNANLKNHKIPDTNITYYEHYGPIENWDTSQITNMNGLFKDYENFNGDISKWNTSNVTDMSNMFRNAKNFNQNINTKTVISSNGTNYIAWDVSNVNSMSFMFNNAEKFNQDLNNWNVSNVNTGKSSGAGMKSMFYNARAFDGNITNWDVSNVQNMQTMFGETEEFNQDISGWIPKNCYYFGYMFYNATKFDQDLSSWTYKIKDGDKANINDNNDYIFTGSPLEQKLNKQFKVTKNT